MADFAFFQMFMWVVAIPVTVFFIWWVKLAFRSKFARKLLVVFLAIVLALAAISAVSYALFQSPYRVARRSNAIPISGNIRILNGHETVGLDSGKVWLHISISPHDTKTILSSASYTRSHGQGLNYGSYKPPRWWKIDRLGKDPVSYECTSGPIRGYDRSATDLIVSCDETEALVLVRYWYVPKE